MVKQVLLGPNLRQVLQLLMGQSAGLPVPRRQLQRPTVAGAAAVLKCTPHAVRRVVKAFQSGGLATVRALRWQRGRPVKPLPLSTEDWAWAWATDKGTLYAQVGLSLKARAHQLSIRIGRPVKPWELRRLYRLSGVTQQRLSHRHGPATGPAKPPEQE